MSKKPISTRVEPVFLSTEPPPEIPAPSAVVSQTGGTPPVTGERRKKPRTTVSGGDTEHEAAGAGAAMRGAVHDVTSVGTTVRSEGPPRASTAPSGGSAVHGVTSVGATYPRDLIGYGHKPPHAQWPGRARVAVQFVLNYEEGGENSVLHGDAGSEQFLSEMFNPPSYPERHLTMEGIYEYGSRAGVWRILREFERRQLPLTVFGVSMALQRHPELTAAFVALGHEIACHGLRWINYQTMDEATEREHMRLGLEIITQMTGQRPLGWYTGRDSPRTRRLVADDGQLAYDSDYYGDDLPFWMEVERSDGTVVPRLVVPYALDTNDMRFALPQGFSQGEDFFTYLRDSFDALYAEGESSPKMLSIGMHCRLLGRPGRIVALQRFLDHIQKHERVWICRRVDIARHWMQAHPYKD